MKSKLIKILHPLAGKYLVSYVLDAAREAGAEQRVLVVGHQRQRVIEALGQEFSYAVQEEQLGTGHAVLMAEDILNPLVDTVWVLCGDTPLITGSTLKTLRRVKEQNGAAAALLTARLAEPGNYGRVVRDTDGQVVKIVEAKDAAPEELEIKEINAGTYCFDRKLLFEALHQVKNANAQGEYYLTDVLEIIRGQGGQIAAYCAPDSQEVWGVNSRQELAETEEVIRRRINRYWMREGVTIVDPRTTYIDAGVKLAPDSVVEPFTFLKGTTTVAEDARIGPFTQLEDVNVGRGSVVWQTTARQCQIGNDCQIGPFAYLRPGTRLLDNVKIGDFVELKQTTVGQGSKVPHLSYLGDCRVGQNVNIGAGTITCNYDGQNKWPTEIGDEAFIGSNTNLVAPVKVGRRAVVGAGSTITKDVPPGALGIARDKQKNLEGYRKA